MVAQHFPRKAQNFPFVAPDKNLKRQYFTVGGQAHQPLIIQSAQRIFGSVHSSHNGLLRNGEESECFLKNYEEFGSANHEMDAFQEYQHR